MSSKQGFGVQVTNSFSAPSTSLSYSDDIDDGGVLVPRAYQLFYEEVKENSDPKKPGICEDIWINL